MTTRWQFSLSSLFVLVTMVAVISGLLVRGGNWWLLAALVIGDAIWFCILAGTGEIEEDESRRVGAAHQETNQK